MTKKDTEESRKREEQKNKRGVGKRRHLWLPKYPLRFLCGDIMERKTPCLFVYFISACVLHMFTEELNNNGKRMSRKAQCTDIANRKY
ncbi:hypothetical protein JHK82_049965 [Glycine max]|uniref:Uncharacterized protein n=2 Tax=Glycine subgen. Soja TaxID=1462606 RepID=A0A0R0EZ17_SOYBN|nr:hypothetical protein JHK86_049841 [Glycine max]KAG4924098.1 hypothetical protein JHK87_049638 [Glycine soja]KAG4935682.1 hypothetical protein JHK85_050601 [Glycine max]KAG5091187.1 hypothetical protein JHK82_049965 [Glycine max]KAG5094299.1 hypothetical protein JHK84_049887 [Glycine max]